MIINKNPSSHFREAKLKLQKHIKFLMITKLKLTVFSQKKLKNLRDHETNVSSFWWWLEKLKLSHSREEVQRVQIHETNMSSFCWWSENSTLTFQRSSCDHHHHHLQRLELKISTKKTLEKTLSRCETKWKPTWFPLVSPLVTREEQPTNWVATQKTRNWVRTQKATNWGHQAPN